MARLTGPGAFRLSEPKRWLIRLERAALKRSGRVSHYVNFEQRRDGRLLRFGTPADFSLQADDEVQLKLGVRGDSVEGFARKNGGVWQIVRTRCR